MRPIEIPKNALEMYCLTATEIEGRTCIDFRIWYRDTDGEWIPTHKGFPIQLEALGLVAAALQRATIEMEPPNAQSH